MEDEKKITVLFVCGAPFEGAERSLVDLIVSLGSRIEPIVLLPSKGAAYDRFVKMGVKCIVHRYLSTLSPGPNFWKVAFHPWRMRVVCYFRYDLLCKKKVLKDLKGRKVDVIHSNYALTGFGCQLATLLDAKHVWHIREFLIPGQYVKARIYNGRDWLRRRINGADARVVVSNACERYWCFNKEHTWVILDAVRKLDDCCYEKNKDLYVLFCSYWLSEAKGASTAICAFGMSGVAKNGIRLKMVGNCDNDYKNELMDLAGRYGCAEYIDFLPVQEDVKFMFAHAMAFVNPSVNEGMGRTTAEAMFFGCPIIAYASGGTLDLVKDGETGYLFNTVDECAELMKSVCTSNQEDVILRAQEFAKQNLSIENYGAKIMEVYNAVLKSK